MNYQRGILLAAREEHFSYTPAKPVICGASFALRRGVPHAVRLLFGQDLRIVLPSSFLLGTAFLMLAEAVARTAFGQAELPVGAITGIFGGPFFLWLLRREQNHSAM